MEKKNNFGEIASENIQIGDIVAWSRWDSSISDWKEHLISNRMVCITLIMPLKEPKIPVELFTFSLKLISSVEEKEV
jgi:hypothetical protein